MMMNSQIDKPKKPVQVKRKRKVKLIICCLAALLLLIALVFALMDRVMTVRVQSTLSDELEADVQVIEVDGARLHYRHMGDNEEVLLLIHGFMGSSYDFHQIMPVLAEHFTVYAVDQIGFGLSDKSTDLDYRKANSASLIASMMENLNVEHYHILGHSMGGEVAMHIALNRPDNVSRLILLNSAGLTDPQQGRNTKLPAFLIEYVFKNYTLQRLVFNRTVYDQNVASRDNFNRFFYFNKQIPARTLVKITQDNDSGSLADQISDINQPSLVIWGRQDNIIPLEQGMSLYSQLRNSEIVILENCGHLPYLEKPHELSGHIRSFLTTNNGEGD